MDSLAYDKIDKYNQNKQQFKNSNFISCHNNNESTKNHKDKKFEPPAYQNE